MLLNIKDVELNNPKINIKITIIESLVTPGKIKSYKSGVTIYAFLPFLLLNTKKIFDAPTYIIFRSSNNHNTC